MASIKIWRDPARLAAKLEELRGAGRDIVTANGCFEILHVGHVRYLQAARAQGDLLVVMVNTDASVGRIKPERELVVPEADRMELVAALESVDYVVPLPDDTPERLLEIFRPAVHAKGTDYDPAAMPETAVVEAHGGRVAIVGGPKQRSSTELRKKLGDF
ncbi:MAG: adenylyltransferase/cytidyltransferase family protein [Planctomycetota bacterium]